jgi:hypothetical protein
MAFLRSAFKRVTALFSAKVDDAPVTPVVPGFKPPEPESELDVEILDQIARVGWYHVHVQGEGDTPNFAFSMGYYANFLQPEVIVFGFPPAIAQQFLNITAVRFAGAKQAYEMYTPYDDIAEGGKIAFIPVDRSHYPAYFGYAGWFYDSIRADFPAIQLVWPDKQGLFPWDEGYDQAYFALQPVLDK